MVGLEVMSPYPPSLSHMTTHTLPSPSTSPSPHPPLTLPIDMPEFLEVSFPFSEDAQLGHHYMHPIIYTAMQPMRCLQLSKQINCSGVHCVRECNESLLAYDKRCWRSTEEDVILRACSDNSNGYTRDNSVGIF